MIKKSIKYFFIFLGIIVSLFILTDIYFVTRTYPRGACTIVGSIENYYEFLKYENFKKEEYTLDSYEFLRDSLHEYNKECKEFNVTEEIIIDNIFKRATMELKRK